MNKYLSNKVDNLVHSAEKDLRYAYGGDVVAILEGVVKDIEAMTKDDVFPLPKFIHTLFQAEVESVNCKDGLDADTIIEHFYEISDGLRKMLNENAAHEMFLKEVEPLMVKEDKPLRRVQFSAFVDNLVRDGVVHNDVAKEWGQPIEFI